MIKCYFSDVSEHDMDMLFMEEFICSNEFRNLFTNQVGFSNARILSAHSSKRDPLYGESDITVILESAGERIGLLIEDKIDAIAMPEQATRYFLRGDKGIKSGEYGQFFVFIVAPRKYLIENSEAHKYPNKIEYETVLAYFEQLNDPRSEFKIQQIRKAIEKVIKWTPITPLPVFGASTLSNKRSTILAFSFFITERKKVRMRHGSDSTQSFPDCTCTTKQKPDLWI